MPPIDRALRIANCSGYYGDRPSAALEMVSGGPIDVLTGDYLAELTMLILWKDRQRNPDGGYAASFLLHMRDVLGECLSRGIKVVVNAGGLNPAGLAAALRGLAAKAGLHPSVAYLEGDDLLPRLDSAPIRHITTGQPLSDAPFTPITANAYVGSWGIAAALTAGADVVICGRVSDASLVVGPSAWAFGWALDDWDRLAGAVAAGHILECGAQATGGNYSFFTEIADPVHPGFPIAEMAPDGSCVITKHPGTGGAVTVETVTAQLLYEIGAPAYLNPDVVAHFDTLAVTPDGPDRVRVSGTRGGPAPADLKVTVNYQGGYRNTARFQLAGLDLDAKARFAEATARDALGSAYESVDVHRDGDRLTVTVKGSDEALIGRGFFTAIAGTALSSYPGLYLDDASPRATAYGVYWPALVPADEIAAQVVMPDGRRIDVPEPPRADAAESPAPPIPPAQPIPPAAPVTLDGPTVSTPLGRLAGARSGDKGGDANVGIWVRSDAAWDWLRTALTVDWLRTALPDAAALEVSRYELANLRAVNFVVHGLLGEGVAASTRPDPQAKSLGEVLRAVPIEIPEALLNQS
jgi:hypothetical protein